MNKFIGSWNRFCALRFVIVGGWNTLFAYLVFAALYHFWGGGWGDVGVQIVSAVLGISNAFVCHRFITYNSHGIWWREYLRFYVVYGGQVFLQALLFFVFSTYWRFNGYAVQLSSTVILTILSYWAHKEYSFRNGAKK